MPCGACPSLWTKAPITAILGNNGAGKSTILKTVMGLLDDQPDKGTIEFHGKAH